MLLASPSLSLFGRRIVVDLIIDHDLRRASTLAPYCSCRGKYSCGCDLVLFLYRDNPGSIARDCSLLIVISIRETMSYRLVACRVFLLLLPLHLVRPAN
jgi:hypothetical protein